MTQGRGQAAEELACRHLQAAGLRLIEKNYRCRLGEIDLVMQDRATLVFVEVKYRASSSHGHAGEFVDHHKQRRLILTAQHYLLANRRYHDYPMRFDVVAITGSNPQIEWLTNAFESTQG